jgi:hypothetical protein
MSVPTTFARFEKEIVRLVGIFEKNHTHYQQSNYDEASLRQEFLNPLFTALGWDVENKAGAIPTRREVEVESRTRIGGRNRRADYLFRTDGLDRFVCEAKKPSTTLDRREAFQAKRYAWNKGVPVAVLTDFEDLKVYVVGGRPHPDKPEEGEWKSWHYLQFPAVARELWELLSRERVASGAIDSAIEALPKRAKGAGRAKQQWILKPDRSRALDTDFLNFLDTARKELASDLYKHNDHGDLLRDNRLNEAVHRILDRILFLRICEDRDIDTGIRLDSIVEGWRRGKGMESGVRAKRGLILEEPAGYRAGDLGRNLLWSAVVSHFRALDRRPPSHVPFFNGNLFKPHFCEDLKVGDDWIAGFISELSSEESPYLFDVIPVEILGTIYERFLGKVVRPHGKGITVEEKPEVRKAGGVYYTPRYIVDYIVEQTVGKLVSDKSPESTLKIRVLDPACGSGSFLIRAFERMCEHWQRWLTQNPAKQKKIWCRVDPETHDVHLSVELKRRILTHNIFGVDLDAAAVEVTQLSLYLKMLEGENRTTLRRERELFAEATALLPPLHDNIKCFNSLIGSDFSGVPDDLLRVNAGDWSVQFPQIMKAGGFDAVIGNPPYVLLSPDMFEGEVIRYLRSFEVAQYKADLFHLFIEKGIRLLRDGGQFGMIVPNTWLTLQFTDRLRRFIIGRTTIRELVLFGHLVFEDADVFTALLLIENHSADLAHTVAVRTIPESRKADPIAKASPDLILQSSWAAAENCIFETRLSGRAGKLVERLLGRFPALESVARASLGCQAYNSSKHSKEQIENRAFHADYKAGKDYLPELAGSDVSRYDMNRTRGKWINYGPWLHDYRSMDWLEGPRILIREISGPRPYSIFGTYTEDVYCNYKTVLNVNPSKVTSFSMKFLLGVLNSRVLSFVYPLVSNKLVAQAFPRLSVRDLKRLPIPAPDLSVGAELVRHDRLVELVDKMLLLAPRLRSTTSPSEKATLQNAMTATDQQIDALVYELYGLTSEEIQLVEGTA